MAMDVADASATGAALLGLRGLGCLTDKQLAATDRTGPIYTPDAERHAFYGRHHREFKVLHRGMAVLGEELTNKKEDKP